MRTEKIEIDFSKYDAIEIPADIEEKLQGIKDGGRGSKKAEFTPLQDKILLEYWGKKNQPEVAEIIGYHTDTCRRRYKELMRQGGKTA